MFTVLFALLSILVFFIALLFTKLNIKLAVLCAMTTVLLGFIMDILIATYFVTLSHLIN